MKLDKNKIYDLSDLTSEELKEIYNANLIPVSSNKYKYLSYWDNKPVFSNDDRLCEDASTSAKELFYTLENVQVDCRELTEKQIKEMANVFENNGMPTDFNSLNKTSEFYYLHKGYDSCFVRCKDFNKTTITYYKFMELFGKEENFKQLVEVLNEELTEEAYKETYNKLNYELDFNFITQLAERMSANKGKYEPYNWQKLDNIEDLKQALFRHVMEVMKGDYEDDNRLFGHLEAIALNSMFINYQLNKK